MSIRHAVWAGLVASLGTGCSKRVEEVCCVTEEDCASFGSEGELFPCSPGLACVANECVQATCSTEGCAATAPLCDTLLDQCSGCTADPDCGRFPAQSTCDTATGECVACLTNDQCDLAAPICDARACRGCVVDAECASMACGDDGRCVTPDAVVYVAPDGTDNDTCDAASPCKTVNAAVALANPSRSHLVLLPGRHEGQGSSITLSSSRTSATELVFHGSGATLVGTAAEPFFVVEIPVAVNNLTFDVVRGLAIRAASSLTLEDISFQAQYALQVQAPVTGRRIEFRSTLTSGTSPAVAIQQGGTFVVERAVFIGGGGAVGATDLGTNVDLTNVLIYGTRGIALDLSGAAGAVAFTTIGDSGRETTTGARMVTCSDRITIRSSIIWDPFATAQRPAMAGGCALSDTIVGVIGVPGASNANPAFVEPSAGNFHITANSPARDAVNSGPSSDFEGDARPAGARYDIGADEFRED